MVDYLATYPIIETKACEREKIVSGYIANGMVDPTIQRAPYFRQIISTCKRQISTKEWELYLHSFEPLMRYVYTNGNQWIPDNVFIGMDFLPDVDPVANVKIRDAKITQTNQQWSKWLTVVAETSSWTAREEETQLQQKRKDDRKQSIAESATKEESDRIASLCGYADLSPSKDNISKCELNMLSAFLLLV